MVLTIVSGGFRALLWGLAAFGMVSLLLIGLIAWPLSQPPELTSISATASAVDRSTMPALERFTARDGTQLSYRYYPAVASAAEQVAVLVHGSSGSSMAVHALAKTMAQRGVATFAPDIRGHGGSGTRGDIGYIGQLEDDMADLVADIRKTRPTAPLTLIGHSSGGGFVLRVAASPVQSLFARTVLLAPYLGYDAPTSRPNSGGWATPDIPRFIGLTLLRVAGIDWGASLPTIAFAVPQDSARILARTYSYRLMCNFAASRDYRADLAKTIRPVTIFSGGADELIDSGRFREAVGDRAAIEIIDGVNHMGILSDPRAVSVIAADVARTGPAS